MDTLLSLLVEQARLHAARPAIIDARPGTLTYADLVTRVRGIAGQLAALGVQRADRVALILPNGPDAAVSFLGIAAVAAAAPLNPTYSRDEFTFYFGDLQTKLAIIDAAAAPVAVEAAHAAGVRLVTLHTGAEVADPGPASTRPATTGLFPRSRRGTRSGGVDKL